ncbi:MAG TPA: carboxypeptidase regulatory-like domain-containing protein [Terriglobales bacterium]|nr:carboxypeptidase regulatory-like domain-containing protein [Terriglobales bacterium]
MNNACRWPKLIAYSALLLVLSLATMPAHGQNSQGTILGHVQDATGAAVSGAKVTARNVNTGVTNEFTTNSVGDYVLVNMIPGTYEVKVEDSGFKTEVSGNLILEVDQTLRQNFSLQVGQVKEVMTITADAQMVQTDNTTIGNVLDQKTIEELPSSGRDFNNLLGLVAGAGNVSGGSQVYWANHGLNSSFTEVSLNGERPESVNFMIDGVADTDSFFATSSAIPSEFAIQEFKVQSGLYSAEYGQGAGQVNVAIKSGTNQWHAQAYDYLQNDMFNPRSPLAEEQHLYEGGAIPQVTPWKQNQFGGTLGGPLKIPGLYNGQNKTFWFFAYDGGRRHWVPSNESAIQVPTDKERTGDFSDWPYPLYDPTTTVCNPNCDATTRTQFMGSGSQPNVIPSAEINAMGQKLANLFPLPNINCTLPCGNYLIPLHNSITTNNETFRVDENLGDKDRLYFTGNVRRDDEPHPSMVPYSGSKNSTSAQLFALNWERTISSTVINTARIGYNHLFFGTASETAYGPNLQANLGFVNAPETPAFYGIPNIGVNQNYNGMGNGNNGTFTKSGTYEFVDNLKMIRGKHSITLGVDVRRLREFETDNYLGTGNIGFNGQYSANCNRGANGCNLGSLGTGFGNSVADLLLSDPSSISGPFPLGVDYLHTVGTNLNLFAQDDIRVTSRLTVNLGLRYELPPAFHSINNSGWGFDPANGGSLDWVSKSFVQGIYSLAAAQTPPVTVNPAFLNCCIQNSLVPQDKKDFAPRIGLSWRPFTTDRFVVRAGYGIFYETYERYYDQVQNYDDNSLQTLLPASYPTGGEVGNEQQSLGPRLNQLWSAPINGIGGEGAGQGTGVFLLPSWDSVDFVGVDYILNQVNWPKNHNPYSEQWTLDTQFAVTPTLLLDVGYVGSHGLRLSTYYPFNAAVPPNVTTDACNYLFDASQATGGNAACATDPNFQPIDKRVPYPNLISMMYANANILNSNYNSLQVQLRQRFNHGLTYNVSYTWSKSLDEFSGQNVSGVAFSVQNPYDIRADRGPSSFNQPNRLTANGSWELPVGKGKRWSLGPANWVLGGWKASGIYTITSGRSLTAYGCSVCGPDEMGLGVFGTFASRYRPNQSADPNSGFTRSFTQWFNTSVFSLAPQGTYGNEGKGELRGPYFEDLDLSFAKQFPITERQHIQVRFEMFNAGSPWHHGAWFPDGGVTDLTFGSLVPHQSSADLVTPSQWAHDNLWQGHTIQLSAVYSF